MSNVHPYLTTTTIIEYVVEVDTNEIPDDQLEKIFQSSEQDFLNIDIPQDGIVEIERGATGFFYAQDSNVDDLYLITNKHVVEPEHSKNPESLTIKVREMEDGEWNGRISDYTVNLETDGRWKWLDHPVNKEVDIVAIPVEIELKDSFNWITESLIERTEQREKLTDHDVGYDSVVIGYPIGFRDKATELPIARKALISTPPSVGFRGQPRFLIDAKMHGGMSGSPVFEEFPTKLDSGGGVRYDPSNPSLLGVHSASWWVEEDLQLNDVWSARLIPEIIESH